MDYGSGWPKSRYSGPLTFGRLPSLPIGPWSHGVMSLHYSNTPILHHSNTPAAPRCPRAAIARPSSESPWPAEWIRRRRCGLRDGHGHDHGIAFVYALDDLGEDAVADAGLDLHLLRFFAAQNVDV